MSGVIYTFGPYALEGARRQLRRGDELVAIPDRQCEILVQLVANAGTIVSKDALIATAWRGVAVTDNSLEQAISALRRLLGQGPPAPGGTSPWIETVPRRGYRFTGAVSRHVARETDDSLAALLAPHRAWVDGRAALETLGRVEAAHARRAFAGVVAASPDYAPAHVGLANACAFEFEATRAAAPDRDALVLALQHAREACRLEPDSAEPWATLGFVLHLSRNSDHAIAAARRAIALEPDNWRHHLRLAVVSWGEARLRAAQRSLALLPGLALAHWLAATVHVARQSLDHAAQQLELGAQAQDAQSPQARFSAVALHWLLGLVCLARGDEARARHEFERELSFEDTGQLYARECCANTWYALGAIAVRAGRRDEAAAAFLATLDRVPGHVMAMAGLVAAEARLPAVVEAHAAQLAGAGLGVDAALGRAALHTIAGRPELAAPLVDSSLGEAAPGGAGWIVPVEPLLQVAAHPDAWSGVLARLRSRAA